VTIAGLAELHQLLVEYGFRRRSSDGPTIVQEKQRENPTDINAVSAAPRQLSMPFDSARLRGMTPVERRISLARLASLLLEAANVVAEESDDGEH
jgi:hypothetical protein